MRKIFVKPRTKSFYKNSRARKTTLFRCAPSSELSTAPSHSPTGAMLARALPSDFSQKSQRKRPAIFREAADKMFYKSMARGKITLLPKRTPVAVNVRLLRKSECGRMRSFGCATLRAAPFSGSRGAYAPPRETFALCKSKAYSPEAKRSFLPLPASKNCALLQDDGKNEIRSGFPSLSRKSQHLFCEICAKSPFHIFSGTPMPKRPSAFFRVISTDSVSARRKARVFSSAPKMVQSK